MTRLDRIYVEGMLFFGRHGASRHEQAMGQSFQVDVEIEADLSSARASDRLEETIDYGEVYAVVKGVVEGPPRNLLERVADEILSKILAGFPAKAVRVRITKPRLPVRGGTLTGGVSVEVYGERAS